MTEKQERILKSALKLFAEEGFAGTSTSRVAKQAEVSEGLIFRHFQNKEGLLTAVKNHCKKLIFYKFAGVMAKSDPKEVIRSSIMLPIEVKEEDLPFWKLIYGLKWQMKEYDHSISAPILHTLTTAFEKLNYPDPKAEAEAILVLIDGLAVAVLVRKPKNLAAIAKVILGKYDL